jgi:hypothetical protein
MLTQELVEQVARIWLQWRKVGEQKIYWCDLHVSNYCTVTATEEILARCVDMKSALHEVEQAAIEKLLGG